MTPRPRGAGLLLAAALGGCAPLGGAATRGGGAGDELEARLAEGRARLAAGSAAAALAAFEEAAQLDPASFEACRGVQDALVAAGRAGEALERAGAMAEQRDDAASWTLRARLESDAAAAVCLARALERDPEFGWALLGQGVLAARDGELEEAESRFDAALATAPDLAEAWSARARVRDQLADFTGAAEDYRRYLALRPADMGARYALATILHRELRRPQEAEEHYRLLLDMDPRRTDAVVGLAVRLAERGDAEAAEALYLSVADRDPAALYNLGILYQEALDRPADARRCFERFIAWEGEGAQRRSVADRLIYAPLRLEELRAETAARGLDAP